MTAERDSIGCTVKRLNSGCWLLVISHSKEADRCTQPGEVGRLHPCVQLSQGLGRRIEGA